MWHVVSINAVLKILFKKKKDDPQVLQEQLICSLGIKRCPFQVIPAEVSPSAPSVED